MVRYLDFKKYVLHLFLCSFYSFCYFLSFLFLSLLLYPTPNLFIFSSLFLSFFIMFRFDYGYAILMEDIGGTALPKLYNYAKQGLPLDIFLEIASKIST